MSLKSAIREAVDARDNSQPHPQAKAKAKREAQARAEVEPSIPAEDLQASPEAAEQAEQPPSQAEPSGVEQVEMAAMTVRVSRRHRLHWLIAAKKEGTSLTAAITEALNARFGEPGE